jgi:hypothetical protein
MKGDSFQTNQKNGAGVWVIVQIVLNLGTFGLFLANSGPSGV